MDVWTKIVLILFAIIDLSLWLSLFNYWVSRSTNFTNKKMTYVFAVVLTIIHSMIICLIPLYLLSSNWCLIYYCIPVLIVPFIIGYFWYFIKISKY